jgi:hypothetical protein
MILVRPIPIGPLQLVSTNIEINDALAWDVGETYSDGDRVIFNDRVFESIADGNTGHEPDVSADPPYWLDLGPINRLRMFDGAPSLASQWTGLIDVTIQPGAEFNAVGLINVTGVEVTVQASDSSGIVYEQSRSLLPDLPTDDPYYSPMDRRTDAVFVDLPLLPAADGQVRIIVNAGDGLTARCGEVVLGRQEFLGDTQFGASLGIRDFSRKDTDDFGETRIVRRGYSRTGDFAVQIDSDKLSTVLRRLARVRAEPALYVGTRNREESFLYGFYRGFTLVLAGPARSTGSIEIESLTYEAEDSLFVGGVLIQTPQITSPAYNTLLHEDLTFVSTAFVTAPVEQDVHASTDWQFSPDAGFATIAHESLADTVNLTSYELPAEALAGGTYYVRCRYHGTEHGASPWSAAISIYVEEAGEAVFTTPGLHEWTVPAGVTEIAVLLIGPGGYGSHISGGGGGALAYVQWLQVEPGQTYYIYIAINGDIGTFFGAGEEIGDALFWAGSGLSFYSEVGGYIQGGLPYDQSVQDHTPGATFVGFRGGDGSGGLGGSDVLGGGGGAAGYDGDGGDGGAPTAAGSDGNGGGGGGGGGGGDGTPDLGIGAGNGGGVGLYGIGPSGVGGAPAEGGTGGSGGDDATNSAVGPVLGHGGDYGGGGGGVYLFGIENAQVGGGGAARIIWGIGMSFPNHAGPVE